MASDPVNKILKWISFILLLVIVILSVSVYIKESLNKNIVIINWENITRNHEYTITFKKIDRWYITYPPEKNQMPSLRTENGIMIITPKNGSWVYTDVNPPYKIKNTTKIELEVKATTGIGIAIVLNYKKWVNYDTDSFNIDGEWHRYTLYLGNYSGDSITSIGIRTDGSGEGSSYWKYIIIHD